MSSADKPAAKPVELHVYLAGPDVFFPDAVSIGRYKKEYLAGLGMVGHFPYDNEIDPHLFEFPRLAACKIADMNEQMMLACVGPNRFGIILANMTPFRGVSLDAGTAFEQGFMSALSHSEDVLIVGYSDDDRSFAQRVSADFYKGDVEIVGGRLVGADGHMIENFRGADNLMITGAIERTGGKIFASFEEAAKYGRLVALERIIAAGKVPALPL